VDFVIVAAVVYMISRLFLPKPHEKAPATLECPQCREIVPRRSHVLPCLHPATGIVD